jgi:uncharacterized membrane protein YhaH (DUF805 family)
MRRHCYAATKQRYVPHPGICKRVMPLTIDAPLTAHVAAKRRDMAITKLFSFRGRFNRIQYIGVHFAWFFLAPFGWFIISLSTLAVLRTVSHDVAKSQGGAILALTIPWLIACAWVYVATLVKRFHDIDWSGTS